MTRAEQTVRHFRHTLLWPLQLEVAGDDRRQPWLRLADCPPWQRVEDEFTADPAEFKERHYKEFVTFLPYVQRFLYGESRSPRRAADDPPSDPPMQVLRRHDLAAIRAVLREGEAPVTLAVAHVDLYFFRDLDVVLLNIELHADDLPLSTVEELLYRFGRAYPSGWDEQGNGLHNLHAVELLGHDGQVLAVSDSGARDKFLHFVCAHRAPCLAAHWAWLLRPLALDHSADEGALRYRLIEYHRMPVMAYLALDAPRALTREDFIRLALISHVRPGDPLPWTDPAIVEFERHYCDDRYWTDSDAGPNTRFLCSGPALLVVGEAGDAFFRDGERGMLAQFRHQYFLLFLIAHFHRAALLVFSDRLVDAINDLDIGDADSVRRFKRRIRAVFATFLRFTHRYWFHELSERGQVQSLFRRAAGQLGNDALFAEVKEQIRDMSQYLDSDSQRRQSNTVVRLTVVTVFGLITTVVTSFFGMNLLALADVPLAEKIHYFIIGTVVFTGLVFFAIARSKRLSDFLETLSDERLGVFAKAAAFADVLFVRRKR